ncbi:MAG TPA: hypothetical protein VHP54_00780 [Caproiciproducens sp.]|nr:hypothetical protein [Caproiciproducens sp.]
MRTLFYYLMNEKLKKLKTNIEKEVNLMNTQPDETQNLLPEAENRITQAGKTFEEILPYLTAGEPDD